MATIIKINDKIFKTRVVVIANCNPKECNEELKGMKNKYFVEDKDSNLAGRLVQANHGLWRILYMPTLNLRQESRGVLAHELFHLVVRICEDKGVPITANIQTGQCGDETGAYMLEYYYNEIIDLYKKATARKSKGDNARTYVKSKTRKRSGNNR